MALAMRVLFSKYLTLWLSWIQVWILPWQEIAWKEHNQSGNCRYISQFLPNFPVYLCLARLPRTQCLFSWQPNWACLILFQCLSSFFASGKLYAKHWGEKEKSRQSEFSRLPPNWSFSKFKGSDNNWTHRAWHSYYSLHSKGTTPISSFSRWWVFSSCLSGWKFGKKILWYIC